MSAPGDFQTLVALRARQGELDALAELRGDRQVQPMLSLGYDEKGDTANLLDRVLATTRRLFDLGRVVMLDATNMAAAPGFSGPADVLEQLADRLSEPLDLFHLDPIPFIPVVNHAADQQTLAKVGHLARELAHGCGLRILTKSATAPSAAAAIEQLGVDPANLDVVVDLEYIAGAHDFRVDEIASLIEAFDRNGPFRSTTILSGSVPRMLSHLHQTEQVRFEELLWRSLISGGRRELRLGDYGTAHPVWDPKGFPPKHVNLKYTCGDHWLYLRERVPEASTGVELRTERTVRLVSRNLIDSGSFFGSAYSWGDDRLAEAADGGGRGLGSRTKVVSFATSHHLAYLGEFGAAA
ncbi:hypothetical protein ACFVWG_21580 [Kribbella sp. NPDC058245]|uniref:beta family protein n=1 Tax=Kribbella sp. NPDC058245 TaxID=3346399 RepID=UPI0036E7BBB5